MEILQQKNSKEHFDPARDLAGYEAFQRFCVFKLITMWALLMSFSVDPQKAGWKPLAGFTAGQMGRVNHHIFSLVHTPAVTHIQRLGFWGTGWKNRSLGKCDPCLRVCLPNLISGCFWFITTQSNISAPPSFHSDWQIGRLSTASAPHTLAWSIVEHRKSPRLADNNETKVAGRAEECRPLYQYGWNRCGELPALCPSWITFFMTRPLAQCRPKAGLQ